MGDGWLRKMDIIEILKDDYQRFPENQTYNIYAKDVYFCLLYTSPSPRD